MKKFYILIVLGLVLHQLTCQALQKTDVSVSIKRLTADIHQLASLDPPRNYKNLSSLNRAADYIFNEFSQCTKQVEFQRYQVENNEDKNEKNEYKNVIASFGPRKSKRIIVGAHYDVCGDQPGADDNGSGVAAILELARLLSGLKPPLKKRIDLVAYSLEEPPFFRTPYMGSAIHAESLAKAKVKVQMMISVDMIGYFSDTVKPHRYVSSFIKPGTVIPGNTTAIVGKKGQEKITGIITKVMMNNSGITALALNLPLDAPGVDFSDHLNYWNNNYPAVVITNFCISPNSSYHALTDTTEKLNIEKMAEIVKGLYYVLIKI